MRPLLPESRQLVNLLESLSGRRVEFVRREDLPVLATLQIARHGAAAHQLHYRPASHAIDYVLCRQVGVVIRMFQLPAVERMDFSSDGRGEKVIEEMLSASRSLTKSEVETLPAFARMVNQWALMQIRSIPVGIGSWQCRDGHPRHAWNRGWPGRE